MPTIANYRGIIPAIACPFTPDHRIDEPALRRLASWLAAQRGVVAVMTNGHTGEVFSLQPHERAQVTQIVASELRGKLPVISSIVCEGIDDAKVHARMAKEAGAAGLDVMPPHHWLRFGYRPDHVRHYFDAIAEAGLEGLARSWAAEAVASGVTVNVVSPAATQTAMTDDPARRDVTPVLPPIGRLIRPDEIASLVGYLLSPAAAAITGQDLQICGGASLPR